MASLAYISLIFFFLHSFSLFPIHARELKSFNKAVHNEFPSKPEPKPVEQPENLPPQSQNGYGLYGGRGPEEYFPTNEGSRLPTQEEFSTATADRREANAFYPHDESQKSMEKYGMSDTRFAENGKYFYDLNNQRHGEAYDPARADSQGFRGRDNGRFGNGVYNYEGRGNGYGYRQEIEGKQDYQNQGINQEGYYDP